MTRVGVISDEFWAVVELTLPLVPQPGRITSSCREGRLMIFPFGVPK
ncbi:hypothetical protein [Mycobacterium tuberculosis]|nr:hypothetical protein [Mycobacterium tuberculosis]